MNKVQVIWADGELIIRNCPAMIKDQLYYQRRELVQPDEKWKEKQVQTEDVPIYRDIPGELDVMVTYQGFVDWVLKELKEAKIPYGFLDVRRPFPKPRYSMLHGLRPAQLTMLLRFLAFDRSGLFQAPTRFGKTSVMINTLRAYSGVQTIVAAPGINLINQLEDELRYWMPDREVKGIYSGSKHRTPSEDVTVCSFDSLHKVDMEGTKLLLVDEPHKAVTPTKIAKLNQFRNARILGFGATLEGRFDNADCLIRGLIGPVLVRKRFQAAVAEGSICPIRVYMVRTKFDPFRSGRRDHAYRRLIFRNPAFNQMVYEVCQRIHREWQTLIFINEVKQADLMSQLIENGVQAIAKRMKAAERREIYNAMANGEIKRCLATDIYAQGVTFPDLRCIVNAVGGGGSISSIQRPGRLAEKRPDKEAGYVIDFLFQPTHDDHNLPKGLDKFQAVVRDSYKRLETYRECGYDVRIVDEVNQIDLV